MEIMVGSLRSSSSSSFFPSSFSPLLSCSLLFLLLSEVLSFLSLLEEGGLDVSSVFCMPNSFSRISISFSLE